MKTSLLCLFIVAKFLNLFFFLNYYFIKFVIKIKKNNKNQIKLVIDNY